MLCEFCESQDGVNICNGPAGEKSEFSVFEAK